MLSTTANGSRREFRDVQKIRHEMRHLFKRLFDKDSSPWTDDKPIRAELFGIERFRGHAHSLALAQPVTDRPVAAYSVVRRLSDNAASLLHAYRELSAALMAGKLITPAAEWLVDNYHLIEKQIQQTSADLPAGYYRQLPKLAAGPLAGHPQIFGIAWAYVAHTDSRFDPYSLTEFINAYQEITPLTIGELWATAISLRLVLLENAARISLRTVAARQARDCADTLADRLLDHSITVTGNELEEATALTGHACVSCFVQLIKRLRDQDTVDPAVLLWLRRKVHSLGYDFEAAVNDEHQRQAAANVTMRNLITSLRFISDYNWDQWFDGVSTVDKLLRDSPLYGEMDFRSRNDYRSAIEDLARHSGRGEHEIARLALECAATAAVPGGDVARDPGYYVLGNGRTRLESSIGYRPPLRRRIGDALRNVGLAGYFAAIAIVTVIVLGLGLWQLAKAGVPSALFIGLAVLALGPTAEAGVAMVNFAVTQLLRPVVLPALALQNGIPPQLRTLVVMPTLLTSHGETEELIDRLEVHYLANNCGEIHFALVTDWQDSTAEHAPDDDALLATALEGIARLNRQYGEGRFLLLHRARRWNEQQNIWMGWERKRGKLHELNRLLRGAEDTSFMLVAGKLPPAVQYVITLDTDTRLPRDAARQLVGKMAHPLNRPQFDPDRQRVVEGYGIMQPRVTPSFPVLNSGTVFQRVFSSRPGIDPYVFAVSDVYQDLFGEGSFAGKGIYEIDAFESALAGRIPENAMLSHDLFEGIFARVALVSDIEVVEDFPERYLADAARHHRWTRGDWQLLPWVVGRGTKKLPGGTRKLSSLGLWKMVDNLRRSLTPVLSVLSLFAGWLWLPGALAAVWTAFIAFATFIPALLPVFSVTGPHHEPVSMASQLRTIRDDVGQAIVLTAARLVFLGHQAGLVADAIGRTLYRLFVSRKNLLEWTAAAQIQATMNPSLLGTYYLMSSSLAAGALALTVAVYRDGGVALSVLPFAIVWLLAPAVAYWMSRPLGLERELAASPSDLRALRTVARRTWSFFDTFVVAGDNMLPPDNFQEDPNPAVAHRTSPTNIGLYLLSVASAREFGWIGLDAAVSRIEATLATLVRIEKHRGHLYNWYDTESLRPLEPKYVSSVDSGNLAGHLLALANICAHWAEQPATQAHFMAGIEDGAEILREELAALSSSRRSLRQPCSQAERMIAALCKSVARMREEPELITMRLVNLAVQAGAIRQAVEHMVIGGEAHPGDDALTWAGILQQTVENQFSDATRDSEAASSLRNRMMTISAQARRLALDMDFAFLSDPQRNLMSLGYRVTENVLDENCYDMLASEASLASFVAIAKGDLDSRHWFRLGRPVAAIHGGAALVSWSGSMFEYLMPGLVFRTPEGSLLSQTARRIVRRQIEYGHSVGTPWGISESAFAARDINFTYQYSNFGVPGLGLKRGLADNLVIAPYATGLAAMIAPRAAAQNYAVLAKAGARGHHGFYEALDFTPSRLRGDENSVVVKAYFAHHQGMTIAAILNAVSDGVVRSRFHSDPLVRAAELLLQERTPPQVPVTLASVTAAPPEDIVRDLALPPPRQADPRTAAAPVTQLLSNGRYTVMLTAAGTGYSTWNGIAINRWREDAVCDDWGSFIFLRDVGSGNCWSASYMPGLSEPDTCRATLGEEKVEFRRTDGAFRTLLECVVSTEDDAEVRRLSIVNTSNRPRTVEVTSYMELALARPEADSAHPAFSKMFVETEYVEDLDTLLAARRRRMESDPHIWVAQFMLVEGTALGALEYETARDWFIGQGNDIRTAAAVTGARQLSATTGATLDPAFALRRRVRVPPGQQVRCTIWTMAAEHRDKVLDLVDRHRQHAAYERAQILAWTHSRIQLRHLSIDVADANLFQRLAGYLIFSNPALRPASHVIKAGIRSQQALWMLGISGSRPILLVRIEAIEDIDIVRQLLRAHDFWSAKRLAVDLVILNDRRASYLQELQGAIEDLTRQARSSENRDNAGVGQIFALRADLIPAEAVAMLPAVARVVLNAANGTLAHQMARLRTVDPSLAVLEAPVRPESARRVSESAAPGTGLAFFNGYSGFDEIRREYVTVHRPEKPLPAPWINVIANPSFGFHCAADGGGYTWTGNSREGQITGWSNDPVSNRPGEAIYVRDESSGVLTGPCLAPLGSRGGSFRTRHGHGYSIFEAADAGLTMELLQFVPVSDTVKLGRLRLSAETGPPRQITVTFYAELVLGQLRSASAHFVTTKVDGTTGAMLAHNRWNPQFGEHVVFADLQGHQTGWTASRLEFLGRFGRMAAPRALVAGETLSNRTGGGLDPCLALQQKLTLTPGTPADVVVVFGAAANDDEARTLIERYRKCDVDAALSQVKQFWLDTLSAVTVRTPDRAFDLMLNGWLLYQTLACRMWARSGFYQASGAYGFRDQLQDSMAIALSHPEIARQHILRAAARQFAAGDVQHWWLPASGMGTRTRISDDTVWLVHCVLNYVRTTGDAAVWDEAVPFLEGRTLENGEHDAFYQPVVSERTATLYEHCALALEHSLPAGDHGLPLIGTGDWNDGMNRVGEQGKGESVWLGWFLFAALKDFEPVSAARGDRKRVAAWQSRRTALKEALNRHGWDGNWYRRGYFDDGTPLGSAASLECRIDAIAQSWAVLSGAANPSRAAAAMDEAHAQLVKPESGLALLFTPPFERSFPDPGYIKAYPPGIRENGGQYTHGAIWSIFAHAKLGQAERAWALFSMLNPVNHARTEEDVRRYRVEPYVMAADIYSVTPHVGRGGWTWYTGAAGWMYRAGLEAILGVVREGNRLRVKPCIPADWDEFQVSLEYGTTTYNITVNRETRRRVRLAPSVRRLSPNEFLIQLEDRGGICAIELVLEEEATNAIRESQARA
jgi:cyclic beta-1,2-glucan synthetase